MLMRRSCQKLYDGSPKLVGLSIFCGLFHCFWKSFDDPLKEPMTMSFIIRELDMETHDIIYLVFQQFVYILRHIVHDEVQQVRDLEIKRANYFTFFT